MPAARSRRARITSNATKANTNFLIARVSIFTAPPSLLDGMDEAKVQLDADSPASFPVIQPLPCVGAHQSPRTLGQSPVECAPFPYCRRQINLRQFNVFLAVPPNYILVLSLIQQAPFHPPQGIARAIAAVVHGQLIPVRTCHPECLPGTI